MKELYVKIKSKKCKNSGSVLIVTLFIVNLILLLSLYIIVNLENLVSYNTNLSSYMLKEDVNLKKKQYVLAEFNKLLMGNIEKIISVNSNEVDGVDEFFKSTKGGVIVSYDNCSIKYDSVKRYFLIEITLQDKSVLRERFYVDISEGTPKYKFLKL